MMSYDLVDAALLLRLWHLMRQQGSTKVVLSLPSGTETNLIPVLRDPAFLLFFCTHSLSLTSSKSFGAQKGAAGASFGLLCVGEVPGGASRFVGDGPVLWAPAALILGPEPRCKQLTSARRPLLCFIDEFPRSAVYGLPQRPPQVGEHRPGPGPALCSRC